MTSTPTEPGDQFPEAPAHGGQAGGTAPRRFDGMRSMRRTWGSLSRKARIAITASIAVVSAAAPLAIALTDSGKDANANGYLPGNTPCTTLRNRPTDAGPIATVCTGMLLANSHTIGPINGTPLAGGGPLFNWGSYLIRGADGLDYQGYCINASKDHPSAGIPVVAGLEGYSPLLDALLWKHGDTGVPLEAAATSMAIHYLVGDPGFLGLSVVQPFIGTLDPTNLGAGGYDDPQMAQIRDIAHSYWMEATDLQAPWSSSVTVSPNPLPQGQSTATAVINVRNAVGNPVVGTNPDGSNRQLTVNVTVAGASGSGTYTIDANGQVIVPLTGIAPGTTATVAYTMQAPGQHMNLAAPFAGQQLTIAAGPPVQLAASASVSAPVTPLARLNVQKASDDPAVQPADLSGFQFEVRDSAGTVVGTITTGPSGLGTGPLTLPTGSYQVRETAVPAGSQLVLNPVPVAVTLGAGASADVTVTFRNRAQPLVATQASAANALVGGTVSDTVTVSQNGSSISDPTVDISVGLFGPFTTPPTAASCTPATLAGTVQFQATGNGSFTSPTLTVGAAGYYTFVAMLTRPADGATATHPCGETTETFLARAAPAVTTVAQPAGNLLVGPQLTLTDKLTVTGMGASEAGEATVALYGPFDTAPTAGSCTADKLLGTDTITVTGDGEYTSQPLGPVSVAGHYTFVAAVTRTVDGATGTHPCGEAAETVIARTKPVVTTQASAAAAMVGVSLTDHSTVTGMGAGEAGTVTVDLYGPFTTAPTAGSCTADKKAGSVSFPVTGDGEYDSLPVGPLTTAGYYTFVETLTRTSDGATATHPCGLGSETTIVRDTPEVTTQVAESAITAGGSIADRTFVAGLGAGETGVVTADLYGPFDAIPTAGSCTPDKKVGSVSFPVAGDGEVVSPAVGPLTGAGRYTFVETLVRDSDGATATHACGLASETMLVRTVPVVSTVASAQVVSLDASVSDTITVAGLGAGETGTAVTVLYGPFDTMPDASSCTSDKRVGETTVSVLSDGVYSSGPIKVGDAGIYTFVETVTRTSDGATASHPCGVESETFTVRPGPGVDTQAQKPVINVGESIADVARVSGMAGEAGTVRVDLFGPFAQPPAGDACAGSPVWSGSIDVSGDGVVTSQESTPLSLPGYYTFVATLTRTSDGASVSHACGLPAETMVVLAPLAPTM